jgi:hypothetical protein
MRLLWCVALVACATKSAEPSTRTPEARAARMRHYAPQRGPVRTTARELFEDFTRPSADGLELLDKYREGARFTAIVRTVGVDETGQWVVWVDIDGENVMTLDFAEPPTNVTVGGELTVTCKIGGASGALMMVTGCTAASS